MKNPVPEWGPDFALRIRPCANSDHVVLGVVALPGISSSTARDVKNANESVSVGVKSGGTHKRGVRNGRQHKRRPSTFAATATATVAATVAHGQTGGQRLQVIFQAIAGAAFC